MKIKQIMGWTPIQIYLDSHQPVVEWCSLEDMNFSEPFFEQTVAQCLHKDPDRVRVKTDLKALNKMHAISPGLEPTGFIFHVSRCGSTLVSQMLSALPQNLVISEAAPINSNLLAQDLPRIPEEQLIKWLQLTISALGQRQVRMERNYFIKFTEWNVLKLPLIQKAFPKVPWVFIYREPIEVMVSFSRTPMRLLSFESNYQIAEIAKCKLGLSLDEIEKINSTKEFCAKILANFYNAGLQMLNKHALLINYEQLPEVMWTFLPDFFQLNLTAQDKECMHSVSKF